ncbi:MAG TPA: glycyl-radical enzyme activating protein [Candidatus Sulfopaludibacter sp.]|nr:glycyl-radical enzyme activating protein [Candidatus Sulfopaludibacter sp.]
MSETATAFVFNVMRFATHDGPGIRTAVFFKGCPLHCQWCHNPESHDFRPEILYFAERCRHCGDCVLACPENTSRSLCRRCGLCAEACRAEARQLAGRRVTLSGLLAEIERDQIFHEESGGGVTLSGGEPLAQPGFAAALLRACRERGIHTVIETCGFASPAVFQSVAPLADAVLYDLKSMDDATHRWCTGVSNHWILENLDRLVSNGTPCTVRIPVIPGINDSDHDIEAFTRYLAGRRIDGVELLPYHRIAAAKYERLGRDYKMADTPEPSPDTLAHFRHRLARAGLIVTVGASI